MSFSTSPAIASNLPNKIFHFPLLDFSVLQILKIHQIPLEKYDFPNPKKFVVFFVSNVSLISTYLGNVWLETRIFFRLQQYFYIERFPKSLTSDGNFYFFFCSLVGWDCHAHQGQIIFLFCQTLFLWLREALELKANLWDILFNAISRFISNKFILKKEGGGRDEEFFFFHLTNLLPIFVMCASQFRGDFSLGLYYSCKNLLIYGRCCVFVLLILQTTTSLL